MCLWVFMLLATWMNLLGQESVCWYSIYYCLNLICEVKDKANFFFSRYSDICPIRSKLNANNLH